MTDIHSAAHRDHAEAAACRRLWAAVVLAIYSDWWRQLAAKPECRDRIRAEASRYFHSRDGKTVMALAGITTDPERLADVAVDPAAKARTAAPPEAPNDR